MKVAMSMMIKLVSMIKLVIVMKGVEDCLLVNIYAPKNNSGNKMPVMVWIQGGSLITGSNRCSIKIYQPDILYALQETY